MTPALILGIDLGRQGAAALLTAAGDLLDIAVAGLIRYPALEIA